MLSSEAAQASHTVPSERGALRLEPGIAVHRSWIEQHTRRKDRQAGAIQARKVRSFAK
jgi:hypothetical protein